MYYLCHVNETTKYKLFNHTIMAIEKYGFDSFTTDVNGVHYEFKAWTASTRSGFCHTIRIFRDYSPFGSDTKVSYLNRTWESFKYETCLNKAINKCPKDDRKQLTDILIYHKRAEEHEKAEKFVAKFESTINQLTPENRQRLANSVGIIETEEQAHAVMGIASLMALMQ